MLGALASTALSALGGGGQAAQAQPLEGTFSSAGINIGSKVVGSGSASTGSQSGTNNATEAADPLGYSSAGSYSATTAAPWTENKGLIFGALGAVVLLFVGLLVIALPSRDRSRR